MIRPTWSRGILLAAASIVALAVLFSSWHGPFQPAASMADYCDEMVSFIKVAPNLELESSELTRLKDFLTFRRPRVERLLHEIARVRFVAAERKPEAIKRRIIIPHQLIGIDRHEGITSCCLHRQVNAR